MPPEPAPPVLVVKLGALGDFVQALGPFAAIRRHHRGNRVVLLTTAPFVDFARASGYFDQVWADGRPAAPDLGGWLRLRRRLRGGGFARVYDLQTSRRSSFYLRLFWPGPVPEWSGIARRCSHPHADPRRDLMHTIERQREQLSMAGIENVPDADLSWVTADAARFGLPPRYALLAPGGARHRPLKRWPAESFAELARRLGAKGVPAVLVGAAWERDLLAEIARRAPGAHSLAGATSLFDLVALARGAQAAAGNDTGPMHLIAAAGCRSVVLYSNESDPALCAQRGRAVTILREERLEDLDATEVEAVLGL